LADNPPRAAHRATESPSVLLCFARCDWQDCHTAGLSEAGGGPSIGARCHALPDKQPQSLSLTRKRCNLVAFLDRRH
jgi:hypothetical protein